MIGQFVSQTAQVNCHSYIGVTCFFVCFFQLSPYGQGESGQWSPSGRMSPGSYQDGSPSSSPTSRSPTLASLQNSSGYDHFLGASPCSSASLSPGSSPATMTGAFNHSQNAEPPHKIFADVTFEDLSASFKNLYKSVFEASQGGGGYGKCCH